MSEILERKVQGRKPKPMGGTNNYVSPETFKIAKIIFTARMERGLSLYALERLLEGKLSVKRLSQIELARHNKISFADMVYLSRALNLDLNELAKLY